jgi:hypothetical protein
MESFRAMCNDAIRIGLAADASSLKRLSSLTHTSLKEYGVPSYYKLCAISKAAGKGNQTTTTAILRVDASKLCHAQKTQ